MENPALDMDNDPKRIREILNGVVQCLTEGLLVIDFTGTVRYANAAALSILGLHDKKTVGRKFAGLFLTTPENDDFVQTVLDTVYQHEGIEPRVVSYHVRNKVRQLRIASNYFEQEDGSVAGIAILLSDLSELIELQDAVKAMKKISALNRKLNARNELLSKTFGQFLSDDIVKELLKTPGAVEPGGRKRSVTVMMSDLRGFTGLSERMDADRLLIMLNHYLEIMTDIIQGQNGTIIEFLGDGIMAIFGAPVGVKNHEEHAVAAALQMEAAMSDINQWNMEHDYPRLEMGIGLNSGEVIVGIIGSEKRMKYGVIGGPVNQCGRIESYCTGGQILISPTVKNNIRIPLTIEREILVYPKGLDTEMTLSQVTGIGAPYNIQVTLTNSRPQKLKEPVPVGFFIIDGKHIMDHMLFGGISAVGEDCAILETESSLEVFDNLQILAGGHLLCKVVEKTEAGYLIQYTSIPVGYRKWIAQH